MIGDATSGARPAVCLLLAAPGIDVEPTLVSRAGEHGLVVRRRCVDTAELLAAAAIDPSLPVVLSTALPRLSADAVARLREGGRSPAGAVGPSTRPVIGLAADPADRERLRTIGVPTVLDACAGAGPLLSAIAAAVTADEWRGVESGPPEPPSAGRAGAGEVIAVWGPIGSPGRTTVAIAMADALARSGRRVCLVDADTYAPSVALALGLVDDLGGLAAACRTADLGRPADRVMAAGARAVCPGWDVLSGAAHWADLRPAALDRLWQACRDAYDVTIVDTGFCVEPDDDGPWSRGRNAAALTAVAAADRLLAVADAEAMGVVRLASAWPVVSGLLAGRPATVVRNRARGRDRSWENVAREAGIRARVRAVPADPRALRSAWRHGRALGEVRSRSAVRRALDRVAGELVSG